MPCGPRATPRQSPRIRLQPCQDRNVAVLLVAGLGVFQLDVVGLPNKDAFFGTPGYKSAHTAAPAITGVVVCARGGKQG